MRASDFVQRRLSHERVPRVVVWARNPRGGGPSGPTARCCAPKASFGRGGDLPPIPAGVSAISIGVALNGDGWLTVDDLSLIGRT